MVLGQSIPSDRELEVDDMSNHIRQEAQDEMGEVILAI